MIEKAYYMDKSLLNTYGDLQKGLSEAEAARRLGRDGFNLLPTEKPPSAFSRFLSQLNDPMVMILLTAATISAFMGEWTDSAIIGCVVAINALLGMYQEGKAAQAVAALSRLNSPTAAVRREGKLRRIPGRELVCGDIVLLEAGDAAPADIRLTEACRMQVDESSLTGESRPVDKTADTLGEKDGRELPPGEQSNMVFMGCPVLCGRGEGIVTATGRESSLGRIAGLLTDTGRQKTPLQKRLAQLSRVLTAGVCGICLLVFLLGLVAGDPLLDSFLLAISLAVAAIPEGLVVVVTLVLSLGMKALAKKNAIIRRLSAVETLGSVQVICSDKTGTLTQNRMTVRRISGAEAETVRAAALCCDAAISGESENGDPTELALLRCAMERGIDPEELRRQSPRYDELPFDSSRKLMTTFHREGGKSISYTKGAPEAVLPLCRDYLTPEGRIAPLDETKRREIMAENEAMASAALRVLAVAKGGGKVPGRELPPADGVFLGLTGLSDPPRPEAAQAVRQARQAGIRVVMISGDNPHTAAAIGRELGICRKNDMILTGDQLSAMDDRQLKKLLPKVSVYARVLPEDKMRIVRCWQQSGRITAMTGDGVNDAPGLKAADIGCAMGRCGSEVSRRAGDLVLADDDFSTIIAAVREGRRIYDNIRKAVAFLLSSNLAEVIAILIGSLLGIRLFLPVHLLWVNLMTDCFPAIALGLEQAGADIMSRPPRSRGSIFGGGVGVDILWQGTAAALLTVASFAIGAPFGTAAAMSMAFLTLTGAELAQAINMRELSASSLFLRRSNPLLILSVAGALALNLALIYIPPLASLFRLTPLAPAHTLIALTLGLAMIPLVELKKAVRRLRG